MLRVLLLAAPGAGKGTQGQRIADRYGVAHLATGDVLRGHVKGGTGLGVQAKAHMDAGDLVPDELVNAMVFDRIGGDAAVDGFVLDGFPRTLAQAEAAYDYGKIAGSTFHAVIVLEVDEEELVRRLIERGKSSGRSDDTEDVIRNRLSVYEELTAPLVDFYEERGILVRIDGEGEIDDVTERICAVLDPIAEPVGTVQVRGEGDLVVATIDDGKVGALRADDVAHLSSALRLAVNTSRPLVICGASGAFCAGLHNDVAEDPAVLRAMGDLLVEIVTAPVPVVVGAAGHAVAAGAMLLLAADHAVIGGAGKVGFTEVGQGITLPELPILLANHRLRGRSVLPACSQSRLSDAATAVVDGWADGVSDDPLAEARSVARSLAELPHDAFVATKRAVWGIVIDELRDSLRR